MSHIWTFSPSSQPLLQRCIEAALLQETENEWTRHFGSKNIRPLDKANIQTEKTTTEIIETPPFPKEQENNEISETFDEFFDNLNNEIRLDFVIKQCLKNRDLFPQMAHKLSLNTVEKLFDDVFASEDIDNIFLTDLICKFLPLHIKLHYSRLCVDLITKTNENYPEIFSKLLQIFLKDIDIPNMALNNYVATLDELKLTTFVENLTNIEISSESFAHNILIVYTAYKGCKKTVKIQNYVEKVLLQHSKSCTSDITYGRLFLTYLQTAKLLQHKISVQLENCSEMHYSLFKRPCEMLLKELVHN